MTMGNEVSAYKDTNGPLILSLTTSLDVSKGLRVIENSSGEEVEFLNEMNEWNEGIAQGRRRTFITNIPTLVQVKINRSSNDYLTIHKCQSLKFYRMKPGDCNVEMKWMNLIVVDFLSSFENRVR
jgi:hypothetical protein